MFCHGSPSRLTHHSKCGLWINRTRMTWELVRNTESQAPPQTMGTRICIFTRSPCALRSPALEKAMATHSSTLAWKLPWTRSLVGCSPQGREESDMTKWLHFHFSLSCIGEGNGNPLQCSCLENPRDGGAWWAAIYGVARSRTQLKRLSSSSSSSSPGRRLSGISKDEKRMWGKCAVGWGNQEALPGDLCSSGKANI